MTTTTSTAQNALSRARLKWLKSGVKFGEAIRREKYWGGSMNTSDRLETARLECRVAYSAYIELRD